MKTKALILVFLLIASMILLTFCAYASQQVTCPICDAPGLWTGKQKFTHGHFFHLYKCFNKHTWWVRTN